MKAIVEGKEVQVGDWVCFKCDIEQSGEIIKIEELPRHQGKGWNLTLSNPSGFDGEYIGGDTVTVERASDCWVEW